MCYINIYSLIRTIIANSVFLNAVWWKLTFSEQSNDSSHEKYYFKYNWE